MCNKDLTFENYKESVLGNKTIKRSQLRFKSDHNYGLKAIIIMYSQKE